MHNLYDGSLSGPTNQCKVYINGIQQIGSRIGPGGTIPTTLLSSASDHWYIGWRDNQPAGLALDGKVDEFHLYTRALSAGDIQELYLVESDGSILFNGALAAPNSKLENTSASLLGSSDELTFCAWLYPTGPGEIATTGGVAFALDETASNFLLYHATSGENLTFYAAYNTTPSSSTFAVPNNVWTPVATSHKYTSGSAPTIRVNFQSVTPTQSGPSGNPLTMGTGYCIGNLTSLTNTWAGRIAHVQVFNRLLSAAEMDACLKDPGAVKQNLRLWLPMTSANDVTDRSGNGFNWTGTALETSGGPHYDARFHYGVTDETIGQAIAIPPNGNEPAITVRGVGTRTKLTASASLTGGARLITTKGYGFSPSTVIEPTVRDVYLYGKQDIPDHPYANDMGSGPVCHAIALDGDAAIVSGCKIFDFRGDGIHVANTTAEYSRMIRMPRVTNNKISHCWTGIRAGAVDTQISGNRVANVRNECLLVTAGNCQSDGNHFFGGKTAIKVETGAGAFKSTNDTFSDAETGFQNANESAVSQIGDGFTQHCWLRNILCKAQTSITNTVVRVARTSTQHTEVIGVEFLRDGSGNDSSRSSFIGGSIYMSDHSFSDDTNPGGSTAGMKISAYRANVDTAIIGNTNYSNEKGIWVPSAITGGTFYVKATGFNQSGDCVVDIDSASIVGTTWVIDCAGGDNAVDIPAGWNASNSITVIADGVVTVLTPGMAY